ncbi:MAG: MBL fold metallo-hydrolase [Chitinophagales bacterium]|nr:MBL fold metallo-hydrolase [Chitinophagales bacterium]
MKLYTIDTGFFKLDGGAMFGVVPKTMWQKLNPPDEENMCTWAMRCLLVEDNNRLLLIDTGMGDFISDTYQKRYQPHGEDTLEKSLAKHGFTPNDITDVFLTHLHFDHCIGALKNDGNGKPTLRFPNAIHWSSYSQWESALKPNAREKASYLKEYLEAIADSGKLRFVEKEDLGMENIAIEYVFGHTESMMLCHIYKGTQTISYCADLIPSRHHIRLPFVMAYDIRPLDTLREKSIFLEKAFENKHILFFEHDKDIECCTLKRTEKGIEVDKLMKLEEI